MHRLLVASEVLEQGSPALPPEAARHLKVLRPEPGEELELFDGRGGWRTFRYQRGGGLIPSSPRQSVPAPDRRLTLFACVTKGSRWDWTVEKATELGVTRIVPVISARTIVRIPAAEREAKRARWMRVAEDAARQSDAKWLPEIVAAVDFAQSLELVRETTCLIGALTSPPSPPILSALPPGPLPSELAVYIGPEGDFTPEELAVLLGIARPVSFGPTVLRAETAAIFAVSVLSALRSGAN